METELDADSSSQYIANCLAWCTECFDKMVQILNPQLRIDYQHFVFANFTKKMTDQVLTLIVSGAIFPSSPILADVKKAFEVKHNLSYFVTETRKQIEEKLLQIDQSTEKIITVYIKIIDALRLIDPTMALLN